MGDGVLGLGRLGEKWFHSWFYYIALNLEISQKQVFSFQLITNSCKTEDEVQYSFLFPTNSSLGIAALVGGRYRLSGQYGQVLVR